MGVLVMKHISSRIVIVTVIVTLFFISVCSAVQVDLSPDQIPEGGQVTINIHGLANDSVFAINIRSDVKPMADGTFDFRTVGFFMPFTLRNGNIIMEARDVMDKGTYPDVYAAGLKVIPPGGSGQFSLRQKERGTGIVKINQTVQTIPAGMFDLISIYGNAKDGAVVVPVSFELNGKKSGLSDSQIIFNIQGISSGSADILVVVDGFVALSRTVIIGTPPPTTTATTVQTTVPTATTTGTPSGTGSPVSTVTTPVITNPSVPPVSVSSLDSRATLSFERYATGNPDNLRIMDVGGGLIPSAEWIALSDTYLIYPDQTTFSPWAVFSISIDDAAYKDLYRYSPVIFMNDGNRWVTLACEQEGYRVTAHITRGGQYALVSQKIPGTSQPTGTQMTYATPSVTGTTTTIPISATQPVLDLSQNPTGSPSGSVQPTPTPRSGPYVPVAIISSLAALMLVYRWKNKRI